MSQTIADIRRDFAHAIETDDRLATEIDILEAVLDVPDPVSDEYCRDVIAPALAWTQRAARYNPTLLKKIQAIITPGFDVPDPADPALTPDRLNCPANLTLLGQHGFRSRRVEQCILTPSMLRLVHANRLMSDLGRAIDAANDSDLLWSVYETAQAASLPDCLEQLQLLKNKNKTDPWLVLSRCLILAVVGRGHEAMTDELLDAYRRTGVAWVAAVCGSTAPLLYEQVMGIGLPARIVPALPAGWGPFNAFLCSRTDPSPHKLSRILGTAEAATAHDVLILDNVVFAPVTATTYRLLPTDFSKEGRTYQLRSSGKSIAVCTYYDDELMFMYRDVFRDGCWNSQCTVTPIPPHVRVVTVKVIQ